MKIDASLRVQRVETQTERQSVLHRCSCDESQRDRESGYDLDLLPVRERARARSRKMEDCPGNCQAETRARESVSPKISTSSVGEAADHTLCLARADCACVKGF